MFTVTHYTLLVIIYYLATILTLNMGCHQTIVQEL